LCIHIPKTRTPLFANCIIENIQVTEGRKYINRGPILASPALWYVDKLCYIEGLQTSGESNVHDRVKPVMKKVVLKTANL